MEITSLMHEAKLYFVPEDHVRFNQAYTIISKRGHSA